MGFKGMQEVKIAALKMVTIHTTRLNVSEKNKLQTGEAESEFCGRIC